MAEVSPHRDWLAEYLTERLGLPWWRRDRDKKTRWLMRDRAESKTTPVAILPALAITRDPGIWTAIYRNPNTPTEIREAIEKRFPGLPHPASEPAAEPTLLNFLWMAQAHTAFDSDTIAETHSVFRFDFLELPKEENPLHLPYPATRLACALNPVTPRRILKVLATEEGHRIVRAAAQASLKERSDPG
jgi:hypothetical protein